MSQFTREDVEVFNNKIAAGVTPNAFDVAAYRALGDKYNTQQVSAPKSNSFLNGLAAQKAEEARIKEMNAIATAQRMTPKGPQFPTWQQTGGMTNGQAKEYIQNGPQVSQQEIDAYMGDLAARYPGMYTRE